MPRLTIDKWALQVIEVMRGSGDPEIIALLDHLRDNEQYVFPFLPPAERDWGYGHGMISAARCQEIEQKTIDILNRFYTAAVRTQLKKQH